jgi:uncharacterized membrane protein YGL010W
MNLLNLEEQLTFYAQYHRHKVNVLIHIGNLIFFFFLNYVKVLLCTLTLNFVSI